MGIENGPVRLSLSVVCLLALASAALAADKTANNTSIAPYGAVTIKEGYPLAKNIDTIESNLELSRASELFLWALLPTEPHWRTEELTEKARNPTESASADRVPEGDAG
jgi:hypothetical protein